MGGGGDKGQAYSCFCLCHCPPPPPAKRKLLAQIECCLFCPALPYPTLPCTLPSHPATKHALVAMMTVHHVTYTHLFLRLGIK